MARISVSLPDELNAELDDQVAKSGQGVSEIVQAALRAYFKPAAPTPPQPAPEPPPAPLPMPSIPAPVQVQPPPQASLPPDFLDGFSELQDYLAACSFQQEQLRLTVFALYEFAQSAGFLAPPPPVGICPPEQLTLPLPNQRPLEFGYFCPKRPKGKNSGPQAGGASSNVSCWAFFQHTGSS